MKIILIFYLIILENVILYKMSVSQNVLKWYTNEKFSGKWRVQDLKHKP